MRLDALIKTQTVNDRLSDSQVSGSDTLHTAHQLAGTDLSLIVRMELLQKPRPVFSCNHELHFNQLADDQ